MSLNDRQNAEMNRLYEKHNGLIPSVVVKAAKPAKNPLHSKFEWDDSIAAHEHRLQQARGLIRITKIVSPSGAAKKVVHVPVKAPDGPTAATVDREGIYRAIDVVAKSDTEYEAALRELNGQLRGLLRSIKQLKDERAGKHDREGLEAVRESLLAARDGFRLLLRSVA